MGFKELIGEHSSTILTVAGVVTGIAAVIFSARAGMKTAREIDDARDNLIDGADDIEPKQKAKIFAKNFVVPIGLEAISVASYLGSGNVKDKQIAAAVADATLTRQVYSDYRNEVKNQLGERQDQKIRDGVAQNKVNEDFSDHEGQIYPINAKQIGDVLCKDSITGRYFWSTPEKLHKAENFLVQDINEDFSATLNDWYGRLGIEDIASGVGEYLTWMPEDHFSIYLSTTLTPDQRPCMYIEYNPYPRGTRHSIGDY